MTTFVKWASICTRQNETNLVLVAKRSWLYIGKRDAKLRGEIPYLRPWASVKAASLGGGRARVGKKSGEGGRTKAARKGS